MKIQQVFIITIIITLVVSLLSISFFPSIQDFMEYNTLWNGVRHSLNTLNASTVDMSQGLTKQDSNNILICIPYIQYNNSELEGLKTFMDNGGTLVLMDDYGYGNSVLQYLNLDCRFSGVPLLDPLFCYKNQWFPSITDFAPSVSKDVKEVILNHATALINTGKMELLAWSSASSFLDTNGNETLTQGEPLGPLPVVARQPFGKGSIILVSDPSILINSMLNQGDNLQFMKNVIGADVTPGQILLDTSHLVKKPMDLTKIKLAQIKSVLSQPYVILSVILLLFLLTSYYMLRIGGSVGRKS